MNEVVVGAAGRNFSRRTQDVLLLDVTPCHWDCHRWSDEKLIPRNTTIPVRRSDIYWPKQSNYGLCGPDETADNKSGRFKLTGIPRHHEASPQVQVSFDIDANVLLVTEPGRGRVSRFKALLP